ncbi:Uncharacterised protein [Legionella busanensis]|uniref:Transmembrane protein n=1 Tax=Legionella busanensis TaxID=190655 RepID=A0A378JNN0_9GAMM|nr:cell division protein ZapB [Legionella busanensis]STX52687.1 Uncharacterised protein [Legionella busanensis]
MRKATINKIIGYLILIVVVTFLSSGFYFWEQYLLAHFLGGFQEPDIPIMHSSPGFHFFFKAWPIWIFPLIINNLFITLIGKKYYQVFIKRIAKLKQERLKLQNEIKELKFKLIKLNDEVNKSRRNVDQEKHKALQIAYDNLVNDYKQSTDFIEKLLDKINQYGLK